MINLPNQREFDKQGESAFHCMPLACYCTVDPDSHFYAYFSGQLIRAYSAKAIKVGKKKIVLALISQIRRNKCRQTSVLI